MKKLNDEAERKGIQMIYLRTYILKDKIPIPCEDLMEWRRWFETSNNRIVKHTTIGNFYVSTVFLGIDHNYYTSDEPILFETMIFNNDKDAKDAEEYQERYSNYDEALEGHKKAIEYVKNTVIMPKNCRKRSMKNYGRPFPLGPDQT